MNEKALLVYEMTFKKNQLKIQECLNLIAEWMQRCFDHIFAYYDSLLPIGSYKITKRLQMWLNHPQYGHKEGGKFPIFWWDNHQGKSSHIWYMTNNVSNFTITYHTSHIEHHTLHIPHHTTPFRHYTIHINNNVNIGPLSLLLWPPFVQGVSPSLRQPCSGALERLAGNLNHTAPWLLEGTLRRTYRGFHSFRSSIGSNQSPGV